MRLQLLVICYILHSIHAFLETSSKLRKREIIVGGDDAPEGLAPYQCSFQTTKIHICGCSVINPYFVLLASHCFKRCTAKEVRVMVGSNEWKRGGTYYNVERLIPHERYNKPKKAYDIALVKVKGPILYTDNVQPIELEDKEVPDGTAVVLTGWGKLSGNDRDIPDKLQYIHLYILGMDRCRMSKVITTLYDSMICTAGFTGKGACQQDSGGPLVYGNPDNTKLVGVVNFGIPCAVGEPDVFAKVSSFSDWIKKHSSIEPESPVARCTAGISFCKSLTDDITNVISDDDIENFIGGSMPAPEGLAPFQCSIQYNGEHHCGCAVINQNFVLTASNCIVKNNRTLDANVIRIMVGSNVLSSGGTYYNAERLIPHELYNKPELANDIALVEVKGRIHFNEKVKPVELGDKLLPDRSEVQLTGWGREETAYTLDKLQYVKLYILEKDLCKKAPFGRRLRDHHFCTINVSGGACKADIGGPLVYDNKLVGIVNFERPCGSGKPDVYADVSYFADWIKKHSTQQVVDPDKRNYELHVKLQYSLKQIHEE